ALRGAFREPSDFDELDAGRNLLFRLDDGVESLEAGVGDLDDADVGLDGAERIVLRRGRLRRGKRVEQRRLADIGKADDAESQRSHLSTASIICGRSALICST